MSQSPPAKLPVCISLEPRLLAQLDERAAADDRSRSWITAKAIAEYLARRGDNAND
jgi:predicted transcriptional regulator